MQTQVMARLRHVIKSELTAASKVEAARADEAMAIAYLEDLSFTGLSPRRDAEDLMGFKFKDVDLTVLNKKLGAPKKTNASSLRYKVGADGVIAVYMAKHLVYIRNSTAKRR